MNLCEIGLFHIVLGANKGLLPNTYFYRVFDFEEFDIKRNYLEQKMTVKNWVLHKHFYCAKNAPPILECWLL